MAFRYREHWLSSADRRESEVAILGGSVWVCVCVCVSVSNYAFVLGGGCLKIERVHQQNNLHINEGRSGCGGEM